MAEGIDNAATHRPRPEGVCDCHAHVFPPEAPAAPGARYAPPIAPLADYARVCERLGIARTVFVTPSVYGTDNSSMLGALAAWGERARGVATLAQETPEGEIASLAAQGVVGVRLPAALSGPLGARDIAFWSDRLAAHPVLHIDILLGTIAEIDLLAPAIAASRVPVVIDHLGRTHGRDGPDNESFGVLCGLVARTDHVWVKLSSWYRLSEQPPPHADMAPIARRLIAARPRGLLWGSNWPHAHYTGPAVDDAAQLEVVRDWLGDAETMRTVMAENPARLYGFNA